MNESEIISLIERLGGSRIRVVGEQVHSSCVFAENHYRGDRNPSFSIKIDSQGKSPYHCFGCGSHGTAEWLAKETGNDDLVPDWNSKRVTKKNWLYDAAATNTRFSHWRKKDPVFFEDYLVDEFVGMVSGEILDRGITIDTAREWRLGIDSFNKRAIFTLHSIDNRLAVVMGRDLTGKSRAKYTNYVFDKKNDRLCPFIDHKRDDDFIGPTKSLFLYGEYQSWKVKNNGLDRRSNDLIIVEGQMDVLKTWQRGWNVCGILGSYASDEQVDKMISLIPKNGRLISCMDGDKAGRKSANSLVKKINGRVPLFESLLPDGTDPDSVSEEIFSDSIEKVSLKRLTDTM